MRLKPRVLDFGFDALVASLLVLALWMLYIQVKGGDWHDFDVFYGAAQAALASQPIHVISGEYNLPFWYPPWIAWSFIPLALFTRTAALVLYQIISLACGLGVIHFLSRYYNPRIRLPDEAFMVAMTIPLSFQVLMVGQMEYIFLGVAVAIMLAAEHKKHLLVALLFPFLLAKPHLVLLFSACLFWRTGKKSLLYSLALIAFMLVVATVLRPEWPTEWLRVLRESGVRTDGLQFTTLAALLGRQENWLGSENLPISLGLMIMGLICLWKVRALPLVPLLSLALALSLLGAPRAYAYDLTLLIPALIWFTAAMFRRRCWLWILAGVGPLLAAYGSPSYLVTLGVCGLGAWKAVSQMRQEPELGARPAIGRG